MAHETREKLEWAVAYSLAYIVWVTPIALCLLLSSLLTPLI